MEIPRVLSKGAQGLDVGETLRHNIAIAKTMADMVRTCLGPRGSLKILVDALGFFKVSGYGARVLESCYVEDPVAKLIVDAAKTQRKEVGDGSTTAVILIGEMIIKAEGLLKLRMHPNLIISGYKRGLEVALSSLYQSNIMVSMDDTELLRSIAKTSLASALPSKAAQKIGSLLVDAVRIVAIDGPLKISIDKDAIQFVNRRGSSVYGSALVRGVILQKRLPHPSMPKRMENVKVALLSSPIKIEKGIYRPDIVIRDPKKIEEFLKEEKRILGNMLYTIKSTGAKLVLCYKEIDEELYTSFGKNGIIAIGHVSKPDMERLSRATGAKIVANLMELNDKTLGHADLVEERVVGWGERMIFIENYRDSKAVAVFIKAGVNEVAEEYEKAAKSAVTGLIIAIEDGKAVPGGGAAEVEMAKAVREEARRVGGKEQLALLAFADALESLPKTLAESAGMDPIEAVAELRKLHHEGLRNYGVEVLSGRLADMVEHGIVEPLRVKEQSLKTAFDVASAILRIDRIIMATRKEMGGTKALSETVKMQREAMDISESYLK